MFTIKRMLVNIWLERVEFVVMWEAYCWRARRAVVVDVVAAAAAVTNYSDCRNVTITKIMIKMKNSTLPPHVRSEMDSVLYT